MAVITFTGNIYAFLTLISVVNIAICEVLTPPYFNLAYQRQIDATSTCGAGVFNEERYCKLTGADPTSTHYGEVIQGQLCDLCISEALGDAYRRERPRPGNPDYWSWRVHKPEYAVDGSERWWQSPPLSRGLQYNSVNLTVDLGQEFHVAYVFIKMANSPRPGVFALDRSTDGGLTYKPWQYFADTLNDCYHFFGKEQPFTTKIVNDDSVICTTEYSNIVPLENGEIAISLINGRPNAYDFVNTPALQEWTKATNVRIRLIRSKTLLGHLMALNVDQDPTVTRRYFYSIKDISIGGRCVCNGHSAVCNRYDPTGRDPRKLVCGCEHNTCGDQCEYCCPGFVQKPWRPATSENANDCEPCQCYGHTNECEYDEEVARLRQSIDIHGKNDGGGVCQNCRHNTGGINCEQCVEGYFRPLGMPLDSPDVCQPCNCDLAFTTGDCEDGTGRCICRPEYSGPNCDRCSTGYYGWPRCQPCDCFSNGTLNGVCQARGGQCPCKAEYAGQYCNQCASQYYDFPNCRRCQCDGVGAALDGSCDQYTGQCMCQNNYFGKDCDKCAPGYYNYPACNLCQCDPNGCTAEICDASNGFCICKDNFAGDRCDQCARGFYKYPFCEPCDCQKPGSRDDYCDVNGQCNCNGNFAGPKCEKCAPGFYQYPNCLACNCDTYGSFGQTCDQRTGACDCRRTFTGLDCSECRPNYYNYPNCEECNCNPAGAEEIPGFPLGGCGSVNSGVLCECKDNVEGRVCDSCKIGFFDLDRNNPHGCDNCDCHRAGTTGGQNHCDRNNGQCVCKTFSESRRCDECMDGMYSLREYNHFGCDDCKCDVGGSLDGTCDKVTGDCNCRPRITGRMCEEPISTHYFPTLYHHKYEMEDGKTIRGGPVRYGYDNKLFPDFSWRGYAILSRVQDEVVIEIDVTRTTLFRIIYSFVNRNPDTVTAEVTVKSDVPGSEPQTSTVYFPATGGQPQLINAGTTVYLTSGRWTVHLKSPRTLFVDYMAMLPSEYYEASVLQQPVNTVCKLPGSNEPCKHYVYVDVSTYPVAEGEQGTVRIGNQQDRTQIFPNQDITDKLESSGMAYLDQSQTEVSFSLPLLNPGRYYLILLYHSSVEGRLQDVQVEVASQGVRDNGALKLAGCPYTSLCRQVVVDGAGDAKIFDFRGNFASILLAARGSDIDLAIDSIVAIPVDQWNLELIQPRLKCIQVDQQCVESRYQYPTGAVQVQFESGPNAVRVADDIPPNIIDTSVKVIKLNGAAPTVNVKASVDRPGPYAFVVHYFQPYDVGFDVHVEVLVGPQVYPGKFRADYCPGVSGCRAAVSFDGNSLDAQILDLSDLDIIVAFNNSMGRPIWLDYVLVIPAPQSFPDDVLEVRPVDKSAEFINECASNHFYTDENANGFCRDGVFSLTTDYNNGALSCDCNIDGSLSFVCEPFGGQCRCKPNVIGRDCQKCRTGYYGFPNCKACNCPSGLCDDRTGQCMCPPHVTGDNCDTCLAETFGFDQLIGCEECNCDPDGVRRRNMACDVVSGQCECRKNIMGRRCDECSFGFYGFPTCRQCTCNIAGTEPRICDPYNARCICKENVEGADCDRCKQGTYYLEDRNSKGCTQCFCFGTTSQCQASNWRRTEIREMIGWGMTNLHIPLLKTTGQTVETFVDADNVRDPNMFHYWVAPEFYLKNQVTAYGGSLTYTVKYDNDQAEASDSLIRADVRLEGHNMTLTHISRDQPEPGTDLKVEVVLLENNFVHEINGAPVTRQQFMLTLSHLDSLQIRASYHEKISYTSLSEVVLDAASEDGRGEVAQNVEQCRCPPNYSGTSCEMCAPGYYRSKSGPFLGECVACQCNGKSNICDPETGVCAGCRDSFTGPQCLKCMRGHYEDPYTGRCEQCPCPGNSGNNFASTCQVSPRGVVERCACDQGYAGSNCGICDNGYWGDPRIPGGRCELCECNNNIDIRDRLSCDLTSGACLRCINNSTGETCERCRDWFWGDALGKKDCRECKCDRMGSELCDTVSGSCLCKPNVVGPECNRCAPGTHGFNSGRGCTPCDCAEAAYSNTCDLETGQCSCPPGVTGLRCDQCERGYFGYSAQGCQKCDCESDGAVTCDTVTGKCQCLPGVTGPKCDSCLPRWVLIPDQGCIECDQCVTLLLDDLDAMDLEIDEMSGSLSSVHVGVAARKRLQAINDTVIEYRPRIENIVSNPTDASSLDPIKQELMAVQDLATRVREKGVHTEREADVVQMDAKDVRMDAEDLGALAAMANDAANEAVTYAEGVLRDILSNIRDKNVANLVTEAEGILQEIQQRDFSDNEKTAEEELVKAIDALNRAKGIHDEAEDQANRTMSLGRNVVDISDKLKDLMNNSRHSIDNSKAAIDINRRTKQQLIDLQRNLAEIKSSAEDAAMMEDMANDLLEQARDFLDAARTAFLDVERESSQLDTAMTRLQDVVDQLKDDNQDLNPLVQRAMTHARSLQKEAERLDSLLADTRSSAQGALNASHAYESIVEAIDQAMVAAEEAIKASIEAKALSNGLAQRAKESRKVSEGFKVDAQDVKQRVQTQLKPRLDRAVIETDRIEELNADTSDALDRLNAGLDMLPEGGYGQEAQEAADKAMDAQQTAEDAKEKIQAIKQELPGDLDRVREIPTMIDEANRDIVRSQTQVDNVIGLVPQINDLVSRLNNQSKRIQTIGEDLTEQIRVLRENIKLSRGESARIEIGIQFKEDVVLEVRNPANIRDAGGYSKLSLYFRKDPTNANGFLAYVGPDVKSRQQYNDYMALEMKDGYIVFKFDLGEGPGVIRSNRTYNDGLWHEVIAIRTGKSGTLTVRTEKEPNDETKGVSPGTKSVFDLNPDSVKFFIGGIPESAGLTDRLDSIRFIGAIEDVNFDGVPVGLWDFVYGENNNQGVEPRDVLTSVTTNGFRFSGDGYVQLGKLRFRPERASRVEFDFKTYSENGLMFLMGMEEGFKDFFAIELKDGKVLFQYGLGSGNARLQSKNKVNDGSWHKLVCNRSNKQGHIQIDGSTVDSGASKGTQFNLDIGDNLYIGGYSGTHSFPDVSNEAFEGCIKDVQLGSAVRDINDNQKALNVVPGCTEVSRIVSFDGQNSFIAMDPVNINSNYQMTMKMKSTANSGLLFYVTDDSQDQKNAMSVIMENGKIALITAPEAEPTILMTDVDTYNDGGWHFITVTKIGKDIQLDIDDSEMVKIKYNGAGKKRVTTTTPLYFGGIPPGFPINSVNVNGIDTSLLGCIGDVTINGNFINFAIAAPTNMRGVSLKSCPIPDPAPPSTPRPSLPTYPPPRPTGDGEEEVDLTCSLPLRPALEAADEAEGTRFGANPESRWQFDAVPGVIIDSSSFNVEFKTKAATGVLFYVSDENHQDFMALYIEGGMVHYDFNCGSGAARITSLLEYNDDQWHTVEFSRNERSGTLLIDGREEQTGESTGSTRSLNVKSPFYVGGIPNDVAVAAAANLEDVTGGFVGCIRYPSLQGTSFGSPSADFATQPCSGSMESGTFIGDGGGNVQLIENFEVKLDKEIYLEVRARTVSGVLASVYSQTTGEYLVVQLVNGDVVFNVYNGVGEDGEGEELSTSFIPSPRNSMCDGKWHTIKAEKNKNVVRVAVDNVYSKVGVGVEGVSETNTNDPLYIGGVPVRHTGVRTTDDFVGCIRNVKVDGIPQNLSSGVQDGNVNLNSCPAN